MKYKWRFTETFGTSVAFNAAPVAAVKADPFRVSVMFSSPGSSNSVWFTTKISGAAGQGLVPANGPGGASQFYHIRDVGLLTQAEWHAYAIGATPFTVFEVIELTGRYVEEVLYGEQPQSLPTLPVPAVAANGNGRARFSSLLRDAIKRILVDKMERG